MMDYVLPEGVAAFDISIEDAVKPFPNAWIESHTFHVNGPSKTFVLRRWDGEERTRRMLQESEMLRLLKFGGFRKVPCRTHTVDGKPWFIDRSEVGWTAYQYVRGSHISEASADTARIAGTALAELHSIGNRILEIYGAQSSRLLEIPNAINRMLSETKHENI